MRRSDREITDVREMVEILSRCDVMRLAFRDGDYPYILPLNFGMEEREGIVFYFHGAAEGYKYTLIGREGKASFEADCSHRLVLDGRKGACTMEYESVIGRGRVSEITERAEKLRALRLIMKHYGREEFAFREEVAERTRVFRLEVDGMTGKRRIKRES